MSHRIDIELTSEAGSEWTWRVAGARQPRGTLDASLLYPGARVGDVVRAEAERELDGTRIVSVIAPKAARQGPELLEIVSSERDSGGVRVIYADGDRERRPRRDRDGDRGDRPGRPDRGAPRDRDRGERKDRADRPRSERGDRPNREERRPRVDARDGAPGGATVGVAAEQRSDRGPRGPRPEGGPGSRPPRADRPSRERPDRAKPRRLNPTRAHRDALLGALPPEQRPVAEQLFRGGIPAVRQAIIDQNAQLRAAGQTEIPAAPLLGLADELLPRVRQADWLDRAQSALDIADEIAMRDLRALVTQADGVTRDDASRQMAAQLRDALGRRVEGEREGWAKEIGAALDEGRVVRAVRLSGRVPDPAAKLAPELQARLVAETNSRLTSATPSDQWAALIEAAADAPFRREVAPEGLPEKPSEALLAAAAQASNRIPALLKLLGLSMPPPPRPKGASGASAPTAPRIPPPPRLAAPAATASSPAAEPPIADGHEASEPSPSVEGAGVVAADPVPDAAPSPALPADQDGAQPEAVQFAASTETAPPSEA